MYLTEISQSVHLKFLDVLDHLQNHSGAAEDTTAAPPALTSQGLFQKKHPVWIG